jgi:hypothetical protein
MNAPIGPVPGPDKVPVERIKEVQFRIDQLAILWRITMRLSTRDVVRLNELLSKISPEDLAKVATFAEGLVEWASGVPESSDAQRS